MSEIQVNLLKLVDVASHPGVSRSWLYEAAREGRVPCVRLGGADGPLRFSEDELTAWLEHGRSTDRRAAS